MGYRETFRTALADIIGPELRGMDSVQLQGICSESAKKLVRPTRPRNYARVSLYLAVCTWDCSKAERLTHSISHLSSNHSSDYQCSADPASRSRDAGVVDAKPPQE